MFIAAVLFFISGIYLQTVFVFSVIPVVILLLAAIVAAVLTFSKNRRLFIGFLLICLALAGILRINTGLLSSKEINISEEEPTIFAGTVAESSKQIKIIQLLSPKHLNGIKTTFRTEETLEIGDSVKIFGNLTELNPTFNNPYTTSWKWLKRLEGIQYEIKGKLIYFRHGENIIQRLRNTILTHIEQSGAKHDGILKAITIGDKTSLDDSVKMLFLRTGTSHILAISGLHVGIIMGFLFFFAKWAIGKFYKLRLSGKDKRYASIITIPFVWFFMLLSGSGVSTIRATIMITVFLISVAIERQRDILNTIALGAFIILLIYPHSVFMPSFQLSFVSVTFIVIVMQRFYGYIRKKHKTIQWLLSSLITTSAATIGTLPIVMYHFYGINPFCMIHNLVSIPIMCMAVVPISITGAILPFGDYLLRFAGEITHLAVTILSYMDIGYLFPVVRPSLFEGLCFYALTLCIIFLDKRFVRRLLYVAVIPAMVFSTVFAFEKRFNRNLCFNFIDVGLGEAILVEAPGGLRVLIDGGSNYRGNYDTGKYIITPILLSKKILTLDYVVNTHPHNDHIGGLPYIIENFHVGKYATSAYSLNDGQSEGILKIIRKKGIKLELWKRNDSFAFNHDVKLFVLHPPSGYPTQNPNQSSLVLKFSYGNTAFLLTGDIESDTEEMLIFSNKNLKSDVLKVPHHGSNNASSAAFIRAVQPRIAVISVGRGIKGLPGKDTILRYNKFSIPLFTTQNNGFIEVCSDHNNITCSLFKR